MAKLIGTAGHVDHGKTSLIRALTGIDADRLPEEKARGMTIDIGFAYVDLPEHGRVSIVDVPGHEKFLSNMLVGALAIDVALLCVAADEGVKPQTKEHLQILELLPMGRLVVALTRSDLVDSETRELATLEVLEQLGETKFSSAPVVAVSAVTGEGLEQLRLLLAQLLNETPEPTDAGPWYLPVDRTFNVKGHGCVVTGTLARGRVAVGETAVLEPGGIEVRIRTVQVHGDAVTTSERGHRTALNLSGVKQEEVQRGMALGAPGALFVTRAFDGRVRWIAPVKHGLRVRVSIGSEEAFGRIFLSDADPETVQIRLESEVAVAQNQPFIVRRYSPPDLLGGGAIVVPVAKARRKSERAEVVTAAGPEDAILAVLEGKVEGVSTEEVCRRLGQTPQSLGDDFERLSRSGKVKGFAGLWFTTSAFGEAANRFLNGLLEAHAATPSQATTTRERALAAAGLKWQGKPLDRIISALVAEGRLHAHGTALKHPEFQVQLAPKVRAFLDRVLEALRAEPVNAPNPHQLAQQLHVPIQAVEEILKIGVQAGEVVRLDDVVYYATDQLTTLKQRVAVFVGTRPFTAAELRDHLGTTRKYIIPLLEHLDSIRFTTRTGDTRRINEQAKA